jgi:predicted MFS family arabinose efflux permease
VIAGAAFVASLTQALVVPLLPSLSATLGVSGAATSWLVTSTVVVGAIANPLLGRLGDQYGRRRLLLIALGAFVVGSVICAVAGNLGVMILGRAIQGISTAAIPLGIGLIASLAPPARRAASIALVSAMLGIGGAAGLPLAGIIAAAWGMTGVFWCSAAVGVFVLFATVVWVPSVPVATRGGTADLFGAALLAIGLVALLLPVSQGAVWGWHSLDTVALLVLAALTLSGFGVAELRHRDPVIDLRQAARRPVLLTNIAAVLLGFGFFLSFLAAMTRLQLPGPHGFGLPMVMAGLCMVPGGLLMVAVAPAAARVISAFGPRITLVAAGLIVLLGFVVQLVPGHSILQLVASTSIVSAGIAVAYAAMPALILDASPARSAAAATGVNALARNLGSGIGSAVFGMLAAKAAPTPAAFAAVYILGAGTAVLAAVAAVAIGRARAHPSAQ